MRYLLDFGVVGNYLGYNALKDFFPADAMRPNPECDNSFCVKRQHEYKVIISFSFFVSFFFFSIVSFCFFFVFIIIIYTFEQEYLKTKPQPAKVEEEKKPVVHEENNWGMISLSFSFLFFFSFSFILLFELFFRYFYTLYFIIFTYCILSIGITLVGGSDQEGSSAAAPSNPNLEYAFDTSKTVVV